MRHLLFFTAIQNALLLYILYLCIRNFLTLEIRQKTKKVFPYSTSGWKFRPAQVGIIILCCATFLFGVIGNSFVIKQFIAPDQFSNSGSRLVVILAVIDILTSVLLPLDMIATYVYNPGKTYYWPFGRFGCYAVVYAKCVIPASAWLMVLISLERYRLVQRNRQTFSFSFLPFH